MPQSRELPLRMPYWLTAADRSELTEAITALGSVSDVLLPVLTELSIAPVREQVWPGDAAVVRRATGFTADVLPVRLSGSERAEVLALLTLSPAIREALNDSRRE